MLNIHKDIKDKLTYFYEIKKIPNIIFNGPSGAGKSAILNDFLSLIYNNDKDKLKNYVMYVNCAHGKGIKFVREDLKFFAKTHIQSNDGDIFKSIVLFNCDKLTIDAQSALRRCIELFNHNTRFFIVIEDKYKLLKPILSRFCELYIPEPEIDGQPINLYKYFNKNNNVNKKRLDWLKKELIKVNDNTNIESLVFKLYEKSYSALDIISLIEDDYFNLDEVKKYELLIAFYKMKKEIRNEKMLMTMFLHFIFVDNNTCLDNLTFL